MPITVWRAVSVSIASTVVSKAAVNWIAGVRLIGDTALATRSSTVGEIVVLVADSVSPTLTDAGDALAAVLVSRAVPVAVGLALRVAAKRSVPVGEVVAVLVTSVSTRVASTVGVSVNSGVISVAVSVGNPMTAVSVDMTISVSMGVMLGTGIWRVEMDSKMADIKASRSANSAKSATMSSLPMSRRMLIPRLWEAVAQVKPSGKCCLCPIHFRSKVRPCALWQMLWQPSCRHRYR